MEMTLQLSAEDERILACLADADGVTPQEAVIRAIHEAAARRGGDGKVAAALARVGRGALRSFCVVSRHLEATCTP